MGKASRGCSDCGDIKLYKEFDFPTDPEALCKYCSYDAAAEDLQKLEDEIIESELAYEEALERQELIEEFLRQLDE